MQGRVTTTLQQSRLAPPDGASVLYIAGTGQSGSTLLALLLGNHPQISDVGEVQRLSAERVSRRGWGQLCSCGRPPEGCPFWSEIARRISRVRGTPTITWSNFLLSLQDNKSLFRRLPSPVEVCLMVGSPRALAALASASVSARRHIEVARNSWALYDAVANLDGTRWIVDSSKAPGRCKLLYVTKPDRLRAIHLVRDGRAYADSYRRISGCTIEEAAHLWVRMNRNIRWMLRTVPGDRTHFVRLEELCDRTVPTLRSICQFAGVPFSSEIASLGSRPTHHLGGSRIRSRGKTQIVKNERWRRQLTLSELRAFESVAGRFNRGFGYE